MCAAGVPENCKPLWNKLFNFQGCLRWAFMLYSHDFATVEQRDDDPHIVDRKHKNLLFIFTVSPQCVSSPYSPRRPKNQRQQQRRQIISWNESVNVASTRNRPIWIDNLMIYWFWPRKTELRAQHSTLRSDSIFCLWNGKRDWQIGAAAEAMRGVKKLIKCDRSSARMTKEKKKVSLEVE